jgi:hypothetical protein
VAGSLTVNVDDVDLEEALVIAEDSNPILGGIAPGG